MFENPLIIRTALNLIVGFAVAVKHKLRFEPYADYDDLRSLIGHLDTFANAARDETDLPRAKTTRKKVGEFLGVSFAESDPRKHLKRATKPLGNLPLEVLTYLSAYIQSAVAAGNLSSTAMQGQACKLRLKFN
jgi:putative membrane protein